MVEEWRDVIDFEGCYQVSSLGRVRSLDRTVHLSCGQARQYRGKILKPGLDKRSGHLKVWLARRESEWIHRLVCGAFHGPCPDGHEVLHDNHNPADNNLRNLRYGTRSENILMDLANGTRHQISIIGTDVNSGVQTKYQSSGAAAREITGSSHASSNIRACCRGTCKSAYGYTWGYA